MSDPPGLRRTQSTRTLREVMSDWRVFSPSDAPVPPVPPLPTLPVSSEEPSTTPIRPEPVRIPTRGGTEQPNWPWDQGIIPSASSQRGWLTSLFSRQNQRTVDPESILPPESARIVPSASDLSTFGDATSRLATGRLTSSPIPGGRRAEASLINPSISSSTIAATPRLVVDQRPPNPARNSATSGISVYSNPFEFDSPRASSNPQSPTAAEPPSNLAQHAPKTAPTASSGPASSAMGVHPGLPNFGPAITVDAGTPAESELDLEHDISSPIYTDSNDTLDYLNEELQDNRARRAEQEREASEQQEKQPVDTDGNRLSSATINATGSPKGKEMRNSASRLSLVSTGLSRGLSLLWPRDRSPDLELGLTNPAESQEARRQRKGKSKAVDPAGSLSNVPNHSPLRYSATIQGVGLIQKLKNATEIPRVGQSFVDLGSPCEHREYLPASGVTRKLSFRKPKPKKSFLDLGEASATRGRGIWPTFLKTFIGGKKAKSSDVLPDPASDPLFAPPWTLGVDALRYRANIASQPDLFARHRQDLSRSVRPSSALGRINHPFGNPGGRDLVAESIEQNSSEFRKLRNKWKLGRPTAGMMKRLSVNSNASKSSGGDRQESLTHVSGEVGVPEGVDLRGIPLEGKPRNPPRRLPVNRAGEPAPGRSSKRPSGQSSLQNWMNAMNPNSGDWRMSRASSTLEPAPDVTAPLRVNRPQPSLFPVPPEYYVNPIDPAKDPELHERVWEFNAHLAFEDQLQQLQSPGQDIKRQSVVEVLTASQLADFPLPPSHGPEAGPSRQSPSVPGRSSSLAAPPTLEQSVRPRPVLRLAPQPVAPRVEQTAGRSPDAMTMGSSNALVEGDLDSGLIGTSTVVTRSATIAPPAFVPLEPVRAPYITEPLHAPALATVSSLPRIPASVSTRPTAALDDSPTLPPTLPSDTDTEAEEEVSNVSEPVEPGHTGFTPRPLPRATPSTGATARGVWFAPTTPSPTGLPPSQRATSNSQPPQSVRRRSGLFPVGAPKEPEIPLIPPYPARAIELEPHIIYEGVVRLRVEQPLQIFANSQMDGLWRQAERPPTYHWVPYRMFITTAHREIENKDNESESDLYDAVTYLHFFHPAGTIDVLPTTAPSSTGDPCYDMPDIRDIYGPEVLRLLVTEQYRASAIKPQNAQDTRAIPHTMRWREEDVGRPVLRIGQKATGSVMTEERHLQIPNADELEEWLRHIQDERDYRIALMEGVGHEYRAILNARVGRRTHEQAKDLKRLLDGVEARRKARRKVKNTVGDLRDHRAAPDPPRSAEITPMSSSQRPAPKTGILRKRGSTGAIGIAPDTVNPNWKNMTQYIRAIGDHIDEAEEDSRNRDREIEEELARQEKRRRRSETLRVERPKTTSSAVHGSQSDTVASPPTLYIDQSVSDSTASLSIDATRTYWQASATSNEPESALGLTRMQSREGPFTGVGRPGSYMKDPARTFGRATSAGPSGRVSGASSSTSRGSSLANSRSSSRVQMPATLEVDEITPALSGLSLGSSTDMVMTASDGSVQSPSTATSPDNVYSVLAPGRRARKRRPPTPPRKSTRAVSPDSPGVARSRPTGQEDFDFGVALGPDSVQDLNDHAPAMPAEYAVHEREAQATCPCSPASDASSGPFYTPVSPNGSRATPVIATPAVITGGGYQLAERSAANKTGENDKTIASPAPPSRSSRNPQSIAFNSSAPGPSRSIDSAAGDLETRSSDPVYPNWSAEDVGLSRLLPSRSISSYESRRPLCPPSETSYRRPKRYSDESSTTRHANLIPSRTHELERPRIPDSDETHPSYPSEHGPRYVPYVPAYRPTAHAHRFDDARLIPDTSDRERMQIVSQDSGGLSELRHRAQCTEGSHDHFTHPMAPVAGPSRHANGLDLEFGRDRPPSDAVIASLAGPHLSPSPDMTGLPAWTDVPSLDIDTEARRSQSRPTATHSEDDDSVIEPQSSKSSRQRKSSTEEQRLRKNGKRPGQRRKRTEEQNAKKRLAHANRTFEQIDRDRLQSNKSALLWPTGLGSASLVTERADVENTFEASGASDTASNGMSPARLPEPTSFPIERSSETLSPSMSDHDRSWESFRSFAVDTPVGPAVPKPPAARRRNKRPEEYSQNKGAQASRRKWDNQTPTQLDACRSRARVDSQRRRDREKREREVALLGNPGPQSEAGSSRLAGVEQDSEWEEHDEFDEDEGNETTGRSVEGREETIERDAEEDRRDELDDQAEEDGLVDRGAERPSAGQERLSERGSKSSANTPNYSIGQIPPWQPPRRFWK